MLIVIYEYNIQKKYLRHKEVNSEQQQQPKKKSYLCVHATYIDKF